MLASGKALAGVGIGVVVDNSDEAERRARGGEAVILARATTSPEDLHGMIAARAVATEQGGSTSHAAVVGRALGLPCAVGCGVGALAGLTGRVVTVDGRLGKVFEGALPVEKPDENDNALLAHPDEMGVRTLALARVVAGGAGRGTRSIWATSTPPPIPSGSAKSWRR